ncbi:cryptochrome/photolyase family protein [Streptomyces sp. NPDC006691]|uniref:cryptochrome/photolyase family protein n=1 Tax=Streptomyces sp. NPDC006691 TaxID=3364757 RepID=UPI0036B1C56B
MSVSVVLFTSDLRVHDHPPLRAALASADEVVPLFVLDDAVARAGFAVPNRRAFLADCLTDLDAALRERGGRLVVRSGDVYAAVRQVVLESDADEVHMSAGVSGYAGRREERLRRMLGAEGRRLYAHDGVVTAVAPGALAPAGADSFAVFTPYWRQWDQVRQRTPLAAPRAVPVPDGLSCDPLPRRHEIVGISPALATGGESEGRRLLASWLSTGIDTYEEGHDDLAGDATSRLSPHVHFGTLSPVEAVHRARLAGGAGARAFVRQLCWRDFHHQVLSARPDTAHLDYRPRDDHWRNEADAGEEIEAWKRGLTGYPMVDAGMRQLSQEGWMHNRARLVTASFLTKTLYVDWRIGARHFLDLLVDGDIANNQLNWQWMAGTGTDTRPNRVLNPVLQGKRYDPDGEYVRRWVPELADLPGAAVHEPWKLQGLDRARFEYPDPLVDLADARARFQQARTP